MNLSTPDEIEMGLNACKKKYENIFIRILQPEDVSIDYVEWFLNNDVVRYSDNQYRHFSIENQINYVRNCLNSIELDLYGIFNESKHIGNVVISGLNSAHKRAEISYLIGDTHSWGKGYGTFAVSQIIQKSKNDYKLHKLYAGIADGNIGSESVLRRNGFILEGRRKKHLHYSNTWHDQLDFGLILK